MTRHITHSEVDKVLTALPAASPSLALRKPAQNSTGYRANDCAATTPKYRTNPSTQQRATHYSAASGIDRLSGDT